MISEASISRPAHASSAQYPAGRQVLGPLVPEAINGSELLAELPLGLGGATLPAEPLVILTTEGGGGGQSTAATVVIQESLSSNLRATLLNASDPPRTGGAMWKSIPSLAVKHHRRATCPPDQISPTGKQRTSLGRQRLTPGRRGDLGWAIGQRGLGPAGASASALPCCGRDLRDYLRPSFHGRPNEMGGWPVAAGAAVRSVGLIQVRRVPHSLDQIITHAVLCYLRAGRPPPDGQWQRKGGSHG